MLHVISLRIGILRWSSPLSHQLMLLHPVNLLLLHLHHHLWSHGWRCSLCLSLVVLSLRLKVPRVIIVHGHLRVPLLLHLLRNRGSSLHIIRRQLASLISFLIHVSGLLIVLLFIFKILRLLKFTLGILKLLGLISNLIIVLIGLRI